MRAPALALVVLVLATGSAAAQGAASPDARLAARLGAAASRPVLNVVDSAARTGLPTEPLVDKALEGASKGAGADRIIQAVRALASDLGNARDALGPQVSEPELVAGARALRAGAQPAALARLRRQRQGNLLVPLATLIDLVARGVPADSASAAVLALAQRGAPDQDFDSMQRDVAADIQSGAPPAAAASIRAHGGPPPAASGHGDGHGPPSASKPPREHGKPPSDHGQPHPPNNPGPPPSNPAPGGAGHGKPGSTPGRPPNSHGNPHGNPPGNPPGNPHGNPPPHPKPPHPAHP